MEPKDYARALRRRWRLVAVFLVLALAAAAAALALLPKQYESTARLVVVTDDTAAAPLLDTLAGSYVSLAQSDALARLVIDDLGLDDTPEEFLAHVSAEVETGTSVIDLSATSTTKAGARAVAQSMAENLVQYLRTLASDDSSGSRTGDRGNDVAAPVRIAQPAVEPDQASTPQPALVVAVALLAALLLGVVPTLVREVRRRTIRTVEDLARLDRPAAVLGVLPADLETPEGLGDPASADAARRIATALRRGRGRVVLLTNVGTAPVAVVAHQIAEAIAESGRETLLVDADPRTRRLSELLGAADHAGLTDAARDPETTQAPITPLRDHLGLAAAGSRVVDPGALVASDRFATALSDVLVRSTSVVAAAAPVREHADASLLAARADVVVLVVELGTTTEHELQAAIDLLHSVGAPEPAVLAVETPRRRRRSGRTNASAAVEPQVQASEPFEEPVKTDRRSRTKARRRA